MDIISFEWDKNKAESNKEKHSVSFEEAVSVFADEYAIIFDDPDHSETENRFNIIGFSNTLRLLVVCHCTRGDDEHIRIISARKATKTERADYNEINNGW